MASPFRSLESSFPPDHKKLLVVVGSEGVKYAESVG